jgi:hypothetical protein
MVVPGVSLEENECGTLGGIIIRQVLWNTLFRQEFGFKQRNIHA